jgi:osmotically-inducible protein OsmY
MCCGHTSPQGAKKIIERRKKMARTDELIKKDVIDQLVRDGRVDASKVSVEVSNGAVTLRGNVPSYLSKSSAHVDAQEILGVTDVINQLVVKYPPTIPVPTDLEIENNIKNSLTANPDIDLIEMEVIVSSGRVTLKGTVDACWKKIHAEELVFTEPGVEEIENHLAVVPTGNITDKAIAEDIVASLESKAAVSADGVEVKVTDGDVMLTGSVPNWGIWKAAREAAFYTAGVRKVTNRLKVMGLGDDLG